MRVTDAVCYSMCLISDEQLNLLSQKYCALESEASYLIWLLRHVRKFCKYVEDTNSTPLVETGNGIDRQITEQLLEFLDETDLSE